MSTSPAIPELDDGTPVDDAAEPADANVDHAASHDEVMAAEGDA